MAIGVGEVRARGTRLLAYLPYQVHVLLQRVGVLALPACAHKSVLPAEVCVTRTGTFDIRVSEKGSIAK